MNILIPLGAVALAGFMFWKKGNETAPRTFPRTPVVPPIDHGDEGGDWWIDNYVPPAPVIIPPIDHGDEGGDWWIDNYVPPAPVIIPPIDYDDEGGDWFTDNYVPPAPGYDYGPNIEPGYWGIEPWTKADDRRFDSFIEPGYWGVEPWTKADVRQWTNEFQTMEMWNIDPDAVDPHIGKPGYLGNGMWDMLDRSPVPVQGAIDPHIGKPGYLGNGMWDMLDRGTGASEQAYWSGYGEG
jgi:hypothetical protein